LPIEPSAACQLLVVADGLHCSGHDHWPIDLRCGNSFFSRDGAVDLDGRICHDRTVDLLASAAKPERGADRKRRLQRHACERFVDAADFGGDLHRRLRQPRVDERDAELLSEPRLNWGDAKLLPERCFRRSDAELDG
jgi:hypothetical protein